MTRLLVPLLFATGCPSAFEREPPASRTASGIVTSADGTVSAQALVRFSKGGVSATSGRPDELVHVLMVTKGGASQRVELARFTAGYLGETPPAEWKAAVQADLSVTFAPDGHAVSVSGDRGKSWRHVLLDSGAPFPCGVGSKVNPAPAARDLVLENLRVGGFGKQRTCELEGATRVLCAHADDEGLWSVALGQLFTTDLVDSERYPLLSCLRSAVKVNAPIRERLIASTVGKAERVDFAAEALANSGDAQAQLALGAGLRAVLEHPAADPNCWTRGKLSWSLASITVERNAAEPTTRALLVELARAPNACPSSLAGKAVRVYAVAALAALQDPVLEELSAKCGGAGEAWSVPFVQWNDAMLGNLTDRPLECLAKGASRRAP